MLIALQIKLLVKIMWLASASYLIGLIKIKVWINFLLNLLLILSMLKRLYLYTFSLLFIFILSCFLIKIILFWIIPFGYNRRSCSHQFITYSSSSLDILFEKLSMMESWTQLYPSTNLHISLCCLVIRPIIKIYTHSVSKSLYKGKMMDTFIFTWFSSSSCLDLRIFVTETDRKLSCIANLYFLLQKFNKSVEGWCTKVNYWWICNQNRHLPVVLAYICANLTRRVIIKLEWQTESAYHWQLSDYLLRRRIWAISTITCNSSSKFLNSENCEVKYRCWIQGSPKCPRILLPVHMLPQNINLPLPCFFFPK